MAGSRSKDASTTSANVLWSARLGRLRGYLNVLIGLLAVYGPPLLALRVHRNLEVKALLALCIWATEGILFHWYEGRVKRDHRRHKALNLGRSAPTA